MPRRGSVSTNLGNCLLLVVLAGLMPTGPLQAAESSDASGATAIHIQSLVPEIEAYVEAAMEEFDIPGVAIGIVAADELIFARGFGVRSKSGGEPVNTRTIFQVGSNTKAFLSATMAVMVDRGALRWDDRVVDLYPAFQMKDPWVTREFRVGDLVAQRSSLPPLANDMLVVLDYDETAMIRSLRYVEPVSSFRTTFSYTNITHLLGARIVADAAKAASWSDVLQQELFDPLGMIESTYTAEAIEAAPNHATGHRWTPDGTIEVPFTPIFPYHVEGSGNINSNVEDMARWVRMQLGDGTFEDRQIVSAENLAATRAPQVALNSRISYDRGWFSLSTPNGTVVWHDGDTLSFGSFVGLLPDRGVGIVLLTNETNVQAPSSIGIWILDRILGNPERDYVTETFEAAKQGFALAVKRSARPESPRPTPPLAPLTGDFFHPGLGAATVSVQGDALILEYQATGAEMRLAPWDGDIFSASLMPTGRFAPVVDLGFMTTGFAQFQTGSQETLVSLRLTVDDGQSYLFTRR